MTLNDSDYRYLVLVDAWEETPLYELEIPYLYLGDSDKANYAHRKRAALLDNLRDGLVEIYESLQDRQPLTVDRACELLGEKAAFEIDPQGPYLAITRLGTKLFQKNPFGLSYDRQEDLFWGYSDVADESLKTEHPPSFAPYTNERRSLISAIKHLFRR